MSQAYSRLRAAIQATADTMSDTIKAAIGTLGGQVFLPDDPDLNQQMIETGQLWNPGTVTQVMWSKLGTELDRSACSWCYLDAGPYGSDPVLLAGVGVSSVIKNDVYKMLTVTLDPGYSNSYYAVSALVNAAGTMPVVLDRTAVSFSVYFDGHAGGVYDIDLCQVSIMCCGMA